MKQTTLMFLFLLGLFLLFSVPVLAETSFPACVTGEFIRDQNRCEAAPPDEFSCPTGMELDPIADQCFAPPQCSDGADYSSASGLCEQ